MKKIILATSIALASFCNAEKITINSLDLSFQEIANEFSRYSEKPIIIDKSIQNRENLLSFRANINKQNSLNFFKHLMSNNGYNFIEKDYFYFVTDDIYKDTSFDKYQVIVRGYIFEINNDYIKSKDFNFESWGDIALAISTTGFTDGKALASFNSKRISGFLEYMEKTSNGKILSQPSLTIMNKSEGKIISGQNVPFISEKQQDKDDKQISTISISREDIGVELKVESNIISNNKAILKITSQASSLSNSTQAQDIIIEKREIETNVIIEEGEILYLGGLHNEEIKSIERRVPFISNIPLIGNAFISEKEEKLNKTLGMFLTINIKENK